MKRIGKRFLAFVVAAALMVSVCGCGDSGQEGGNGGADSVETGGSSAAQGSGASGSGQGGSGQGNHGNDQGDSGQGSSAQGTDAPGAEVPGGDGETVLSAEEAGLQVVIYSDTKADFIMEDALIETGSRGFCGVVFRLQSGTYEVSLRNKGGESFQCSIFKQKEDGSNSSSRAGDCQYSYSGSQLTLSVDLSGLSISGSFRDVVEYTLENGAKDGGYVPVTVLAADVVREESGGAEGGSQPDDSGEPMRYENLYYVYNAQGGVTITGGWLEFENDIPNEIDGRPVTEIGERAFRYTSLDNLIIPANVTAIGEEAFYSNDDSSGLEGVVLPEGLRTIGEGAFKGSGLTSVTIPGSVESIGDGAFWSCKSLTSVVIKDGVKNIGENAFYQCENLKSVTIPGSVETIGNMAFSWDEKLSSVTIGDGVKVIGDDAFKVCRGLTSITIPGSVERIGAHAFDECANLKSVALKYGVGGIGEMAFNKCESLESIDIPGSVNTIGEMAFLYCGSLTDVTVGDGVETIEDKAFANCYNLENVVLPGGLRKLGQSVFMDDTKIKVTYAGRTWTASQMTSLTQSVNGNSVVSSGASNPELTSAMIGHYKGDGWFGDFDLTYNESANQIRFENFWAASSYAWFDRSELNGSTATLVWEGGFEGQLTCTYKNGTITMEYRPYADYPELADEVESYTYTKEE